MEKSPNEGRLSLLQFGKEFGGKTSMHGVGRAFNSKSLWKRVAWWLIVFCGSGMAVYRLTGVVRDFYTNPVTTVIQLMHETQMELPAITICNINAMRSSRISNNTKELIRMVRLARGSDYQETLTFVVRTINKTERYYSGHNMSDMLINCVYSGKPCTAENFTEVDAGIYGVCHTFEVRNFDKMDITNPGPLNGLIIELTIQHEEYTSLTPEAGVRVIVHQEDEAPFPEEGGILAQPGMMTSIAIKKTVTHRLPPPYGECITEGTASSLYLSMFDEEGYKYTENACRKSCYQLSLIRECGCCDIDLPCNDARINQIQGFEPKHITYYCNTSYDDFDCFSQIETLFLKGKLNCLKQCSPACNQTTFETVVSSALWPSDPYMSVLRHHVSQMGIKTMNFNSSDDARKFVSKNFLKLEIFFENLNFMEVTTKPMYDWNNLLGITGGHLGLWLGFSILTALEFVELLIDMVIFCVKKLLGKQSAEDADKPQTKL